MLKHIIKYIFNKKYRNACQWCKAFEENKRTITITSKLTNKGKIGIGSNYKNN